MIIATIQRYTLEILGGLITVLTTLLSHFDPLLSLISLVGGIIGAVALPSIIHAGAGAVGGLSGAMLLDIRKKIQDDIQKKIKWALIGTAFSIFGSSTVQKQISWFSDWDSMFMYFMCGVFGAFILSIITGFFRSAESKSEDIADKYLDKRFDLEEDKNKEDINK